MMQEKDEEMTGYLFPWPDTPQQSSNALFQSSLDKVYRTIYHQEHRPRASKWKSAIALRLTENYTDRAVPAHRDEGECMMYAIRDAKSGGLRK